jgi:hypothetical protein
MLSGGDSEQKLYLCNADVAPILVWLEPWALEFQLPSRAILTLACTAYESTIDPWPLIEVVDDVLTVWGSGGSRIAVFIDDVDQQSFSAGYAAPDLGTLSTKGFVNLVFRDQPTARPGGHPFQHAKPLRGVVRKAHSMLRKWIAYRNDAFRDK